MRRMLMNSVVLVTTLSLTLLTSQAAIGDSYTFRLENFSGWRDKGGVVEGTFSFDVTQVGKEVEKEELKSFRVSYTKAESGNAFYHDLKNLDNFQFDPTKKSLVFRSHKDMESQRQEVIIFRLNSLFASDSTVQILDTSHPDYAEVVYETISSEVKTGCNAKKICLRLVSH
ncbi:hypothetical protein ACN4EG_13430 [Alkalinema pantanalense CENA528]